ncbi:RsmB/NOP family class I SAM-dependent RNA methyltransferase [Candidatus Woesearchaeota archaeon]|nr:RsmB/NOP family class I SAM-dependent RNA methyltransferase [Candidatus Woesearchaeota archaeon]
MISESRQIPGTEELNIKEEFKLRYQKLLGSEYEKFMQYSTSFIRRSIRVNTLKIGVEELAGRLQADWKLDRVPWCNEGFWIKGERLDIGNLPEHVLGYFYVQEAASMIPPVVLEPKPGEVCLDMCAAPGSKTTQMAAMMQNEGIIVANDISGERIKALGLNLNRTGVSNAVIAHTAGSQLSKLKIRFDRILVDAPCSATGTIRRNLKVLQMYNYSTVNRLASMQKGLITRAYGLLKEGGTLVYSTCSMEPEENEGVVTHLLEKEDSAAVEKIGLPLERSACYTEFDEAEYDSRVKDCLRIWPQDNNTEGFFVARIRKV